MATELTDEQVRHLLHRPESSGGGPLTDEQIRALVRKEAFPLREQKGPLRWHDREMRCMSRRCNSPTYCTVRGMAKCMKHALEELNLMIVEGDQMIYEAPAPDPDDDGNGDDGEGNGGEE